MTDERTAAPPESDAAGPRVGAIGADRPCTRCGYNLIGQSIQREPHYGLLIARCPECGTAAALQEYPLLGRWAQRLGLLLAGGWVLLVVALIPATAGTLFGVTVEAADGLSRGWGQMLNRLHVASIEMQQARGADAPADPIAVAIDDRTFRVMPSPVIAAGQNRWEDFDAWLAVQDRTALLAAAGGSRRVIGFGGVIHVLLAVVTGAIAGVVWSIVLPHVRRSRLPLAMLPILALEAAFLLAIHATWQEARQGWYQYAARSQIGVAALLPLFLLTSIAVLAGVVVGRSIVRGLVRVLLPPRLRGALAGLWLCDGLPAPR